ncbi:hypothetical protein [Noviherbaspirillum sp. UKPF54]|uniref:hypothetical protein n=1 Tax=Noviherbaspirillum sp. UKPF54 TaxID=2601898 RepID=UPI0011B0FD53|nr:hypothetical protein [Noviherbaspirillum sp. UKPF54]QDZ28366.1 hypothetical protein FAY22_10665 [Noviherbaspirillum sp. UKPF54]
MRRKHAWRQLLPTLAWTILLACFFAHVEIEIEGGAGWAASLPTWRIERHWLLDIFWGGRPMTGYHAWVFPFIALFFHFPLVYAGRWSWRDETRVLACIMLFWLVEDFLWFALNPAYGLARFHAGAVAWHKHWLWGAPVDYWVFGGLLPVLLRWSCKGASCQE